jgi:hypothetical protein
MIEPIKPEEGRGKWTSASNSLADELCPGRHQAQLSIPEPTESEDAAFGNAIHKVLAGVGLKPGDEIVKLTTEQESIAFSMLAIEEKVLAAFYPNVAGVVEKPIREKRLFIQWGDGLRHSGQVDVAYVIGTRALIGEYKSLPGSQPESPKNLQLRDQAVLLATNVPGLKEIGVFVNQPLVTHSPEICIYQVTDLERARDDLYRRVHQSNQPNAPRVAGEVQCKFCRAKATCPEHIKFASALTMTGPVAASLNAPVETWSPQQRTMFMERVGTAEKWLEDCKERLRELLLKDPESVPGYKLNEGRNNPTYINPAAMFAEFKKLGGTEAQFIAALDVGKGKLTEAVKSLTGLKGNKLEATVKGIIGENVVNTKTRPSIVKRP